MIRLKLRFVGITERTKTSPNTWRWQQHQEWTAELPADAVRNVSLDQGVWDYLGNRQRKTASSFRRTRWQDPSVAAPRHDEEARAALAEAVALVQHGRSTEVRRRLARLMAGEPAVREPWLRGLVRELNGR